MIIVSQLVLKRGIFLFILHSAAICRAVCSLFFLRIKMLIDGIVKHLNFVLFSSTSFIIIIIIQSYSSVCVCICIKSSDKIKAINQSINRTFIVRPLQ